MRRHRLAAVVSGAMAFLAVGCSTPATADDASIALAAMVRVESEGCGLQGAFGTGTVVGDEGLVVTAAHVVAGADRIMVTGDDGATASARLVGIDRDLDLALLDTASAAAPVPLGSLAAGSEGRLAVRRDGATRTVPVRVLRLVDVRITDIDREDTVLRRGAEVEATAADGDSGSVVVVDGRGVAVLFAVSRANEGRAWVTDVSELAALMAAVPHADRAPAVDAGECV